MNVVSDFRDKTKIRPGSHTHPIASVMGLNKFFGSPSRLSGIHNKAIINFPTIFIGHFLTSMHFCERVKQVPGFWRKLLG